MQEALLHYIWEYSLTGRKEFTADTGELITIVDQGIHNSDGGPDFINARISIGDTMWAGNVEIHTVASDWYTHKHDRDGAYDNVILHVVAENNKACFNSKGRHIPCIVVKPDRKLQNRYLEFLMSKNSIPCSNYLAKIDRTIKMSWLDRLSVRRLDLKSQYIKELLSFTKNSWEDVLFIHLSRSFGLKINTLPFELLAKSVNLKITCPGQKNLFRTEAILFGQAGFLESNPVDEYQSELKKEYEYHKKKYGLRPVNITLWKFLRLRPSNFPTIRIAQLSYLVSQHHNLLSKTIALHEIHELYSLYSCQVSDYWKTHYSFGKVTPEKNKTLGIGTINNIIINTIVPLLFVFGEIKNKPEIREIAFNYLQQMPAEKNSTIKRWEDLDFRVSNAADSQALLELTRNYCMKKLCLNCRLGHHLLSIE